jgi:hypothetical protein
MACAKHEAYTYTPHTRTPTHKRFHEVEPQPAFRGPLPASRLSRAVVAGAPRPAALPPSQLRENTLCLAEEMVVCPRWVFIGLFVGGSSGGCW